MAADMVADGNELRHPSHTAVTEPHALNEHCCHLAVGDPSVLFKNILP